MSPAILMNRLDEWSLGPDFRSRALRAAGRALVVDGPRSGEASFTFVGADEIRSLNRDFLGRDRPTDVIAFQLGDGRELMGDVYICPEVAAEHVADSGQDLEGELLRLVVHGSLHLIGYDHPDGADRSDSRMFVLQEELLRALADG